MFKCGLYTRVSTHMQADVANGSLVTQKSRLEEFVKYKKISSEEEWEIIGVYTDGGLSGKDTDRPELKRLIEDVKTKRINTVVVTKIDRISRSVVDFSQLWKVFEKQGVQFISLAENFDTSNAIGRAMLKLTLVFAELERETLAERIRGKTRWRAEQGLWNGNVVLGYDLHPEKKGLLVVNEEEAELVKFLFDTYIKTKSIKQTAKVLNERGYRSKVHISKKGNKRGGNKFLGSTVTKTLKNPVYIGKIRFKGEIFDGQHKAIISPEAWTAVQNRFKTERKDRPARKERRKYPFYLAGILKCGYCGNHLTPLFSYGKGKKRYFYYGCTKRNHNGKGKEEQGCCGNASISAKEMDNFIINEVKKLSLDRNFLEEIVLETNKNAGKELDELKKQRLQLVELRKKAERRKDNFSELVGEGAFAKANEELRMEMIENFKKASAEIKKLEEDINQMDFRINDEESRVFSAEVIQDSILKFCNLFEKAQEQEKKDLIRLIVHQVTFTPEEVTFSVYERPEITKLLDSSHFEEFRCKVEYDSP